MQSDVFATLADPMRRRIVEALRGGEQAVNDIVERVDIHQSGVSRHLRILHTAGFVRVRPVGPKPVKSSVGAGPGGPSQPGGGGLYTNILLCAAACPCQPIAHARTITAASSDRPEVRTAR
jgi:DNA-binding transcriptional ArsR family regulator